MSTALQTMQNKLSILSGEVQSNKKEREEETDILIQQIASKINIINTYL